MKYILMIMLLLGAVNLSHAQSLEREVIGSAGISTSASGIELDYNVGETVTLKGGTSNQVTQGFVQPTMRSNVSVLELNKASFSILAYPNPVNDLLNIIIESAQSEPYIYSVYDLSGRIVSKGNLDGLRGTVNTSALSNGTYVLKLQKADLSSTQSIRFIKM